MAEQKLQKEEMVPGVKYRGYGMLNPFKEFVFQPEKTGSRAGREKILASWAEENVTLKETKNFLLISMKVARDKSEVEMTRDLMCKFNKLYEFLKTHEI